MPKEWAKIYRNVGEGPYRDSLRPPAGTPATQAG